MEIQSTHPKPTRSSSTPEKTRYLQFGGVAASPPLSWASDPERLLGELRCMAAGLSSLIYCYNLEGLHRILELEGATHFRGFNPSWNDTYSKGIWDNSKIGMGFVLDGRAWLVFRGSDDSLDWDANFRFSKTEDDTHFGFSCCWDGLSTVVESWLDEITGVVPTLVITGHSLGGAIGVLAARSISEQGTIGIEAVLTFGAPKVGSRRFVERYNALPAFTQESKAAVRLRDVTWQTRIEDDIVPKVCPGWMGFQHCGQDARQLERAPDVAFRQFNNAGELLVPTNTGAVESLVSAFSDWFPFLKVFFYGAEKLKNGGLSHRMIGYQNFFGHSLSFHRAIARHDDVLEAIQDLRPNEPPSIALPQLTFVSFAKTVSMRNEFPREKTRGWTLRLTLVATVAAALVVGFFAAMIWSVGFIHPQIRPLGYVFIVLLTIGFVQKLRHDLR